MIILTISVIIICGTLTILIFSKYDSWYMYLVGIFIFINAFTPLIVYSICIQHQIDSLGYRYEAIIKQNGGSQSIFFNDYTKEDDIVIITEYAYGNLHSTDFVFYDINDKPIEIYLLDNDNQFIYKDRNTGQEYGRTEINTKYYQ